MSHALTLNNSPSYHLYSLDPNFGRATDTTFKQIKSEIRLALIILLISPSSLSLSLNTDYYHVVCIYIYIYINICRHGSKFGPFPLQSTVKMPKK
jgi:hypothetical protein